MDVYYIDLRVFLYMLPCAHAVYYIIIASVTIETVLLYSNFIMYIALLTDAILVKTWKLGHNDIL